MINKKDIDFYNLIYEATNCEPALQPTKLLAWYEDHLTDFLDSKKRTDLQVLFDLFFFKVVFENWKWRVPFLMNFPKAMRCKNNAPALSK